MNSLIRFWHVMKDPTDLAPKLLSRLIAQGPSWGRGCFTKRRYYSDIKNPA